MQNPKERVLNVNESVISNLFVINTYILIEMAVKLLAIVLLNY